MVPGEGVQPCLAMIVGEAPGRDEVAQGRPFVGASGGLLTSVLQSFGIQRSQVYITNVVKELPLDEDGAIRRPYPEEIAAWAPILQGEIENTAPAAILALGRTASDAILGIHVPFGSKVENVYTAWHPSYVLRKGGLYSADYGSWQVQIAPWAEAWRNG
jgi:uracil-DNA glycosylase family 4